MKTAGWDRVRDERHPAQGGPARLVARDARRAFSVSDVDVFQARAVATGPSPDTREELPVDLLTRDATEADLRAIVDIYNQSIPAGWSTADTKPVTVPDRLEWFRKFDPAKRPIWAAEADGSVVAVAYLSSFYGGGGGGGAAGEGRPDIGTPP